MNADRELLELAARAAGIKNAICYDAYPEDGFPTAYAKTSKHSYWNPLTDDGDALRLAVKLGLGISIPRATKRTDVVTFLGPPVRIIEGHGDPFAATRRAIVRAAAEIGRRMP